MSTRMRVVEPRDVEFIPDSLEPGVVYIAQQYEVAAHLCACGCGEETITPIMERQWSLARQAGEVSLSPSIGNFNIACKSHYFITRNRIVWL